MLLQKAKGGDANTQEQAMAVLRDLAFAPEHRMTIANGGGIPIFVDILSANGPENHNTCIAAASCLRSLALSEELAEKVLFFTYLDPCHFHSFQVESFFLINYQ